MHGPWANGPQAQYVYWVYDNKLRRTQVQNPSRSWRKTRKWPISYQRSLIPVSTGSKTRTRFSSTRFEQWTAHTPGLGFLLLRTTLVSSIPNLRVKNPRFHPIRESESVRRRRRSLTLSMNAKKSPINDTRYLPNVTVFGFRENCRKFKQLSHFPRKAFPGKLFYFLVWAGKRFPVFGMHRKLVIFIVFFKTWESNCEIEIVNCIPEGKT